MNKKQSLLLLTAAAAGSVIYNIWKPVKSKLPVVTDLILSKYLGDWYEIARLDFYWEKNLKNVSASYSLKKDGNIKVVNQGQHIHSGKIKTSIGKAKPVGEPTKGALKVSFFGPFYSGYNIMHIDENYQYALIFGDSLDYIWILSRTTTIPEAIKAKYLAYAQSAGYSINNLIWTKHD